MQSYTGGTAQRKARMAMHRKTYLIDLDGTMYRGDLPIPGAGALIRALQAHHIPYLFTSNCSRLSPQAIADKLNRLGIPAKSQQIITSGSCAGAWLQQQGFRSARVIGSEYLRHSIAAAGICTDLLHAQCVVVGYDNHLSYQELCEACRLIQCGSRFVCTNEDLVIPYGDTIIPHTGALAAYLKAATGSSPQYLGKPERPMLTYIQQLHHLKPDELCIIGDNPDTDLLWGTRFGLETLLLSGSLCAQHKHPCDQIFPTLDSIRHYILARHVSTDNAAPDESPSVCIER